VGPLAGSAVVSTAGAAAGAAGTGLSTAGSAAGSSGALGGGAGTVAGSTAQAGSGGGTTEACTPPASTDTDPCTAPLKPNDDRLCKTMIDGQMREYYIYASPKYDPCTPASLIMDCHGLSESIEVHTGKQGFNLNGQMFPSGYGSGWRMAIQRDNAIVVTPAGINQSWTTSTDVPFVDKVADQVEMIAKVDPERVYVTGISMGGMMTVAVGCDNAKRWRGMAPVAMLSQTCSKLDRATPTISFHSMTDQLTSYADDRSNTERIAGFNHCKMGPTESRHYGGSMSLPDAVCYAMSNGIGDPDAKDPYNIPLVPCASSLPETTCVTWSQCDEDVEVVFCTVPASSQPIGGHILYNNDGNLDLAEVAWPFFKKFWK
jgi:poly(3-hydroxybutyrate) depolymerase